jgi:hypothetical protein
MQIESNEKERSPIGMQRPEQPATRNIAEDMGNRSKREADIACIMYAKKKASTDLD